MSLIDLSGRVALVTGGSRGIGAATARMLADAGAYVAITYRERKDDADAVLKGLQGTGKGERGTGNRGTVRSIAIQGDVSRKEDCERIVAETVSVDADKLRRTAANRRAVRQDNLHSFPYGRWKARSFSTGSKDLVTISKSSSHSFTITSKSEVTI